LLSALCVIYNLRAGRAGTAVLLGRVFFNAYLAGQGTEWEKLAEDQYDQLFAGAMNVVGVGVSSNGVGKLLGKGRASGLARACWPSCSGRSARRRPRATSIASFSSASAARRRDYCGRWQGIKNW